MSTEKKPRAVYCVLLMAAGGQVVGPVMAKGRAAVEAVTVAWAREWGAPLPQWSRSLGEMFISAFRAGGSGCWMLWKLSAYSYEASLETLPWAVEELRENGVEAAISVELGDPLAEYPVGPGAEKLDREALPPPHPVEVVRAA